MVLMYLAAAIEKVMGGPTEESLGSALERICFLEWRLEQMESVVGDERRTVRDLREQIAEAARREAEAAHRIADLQERLAEARREMVVLGDRSAHADAERSALERRIESSGRETTREIAELCRKLERERERAEQKSNALESARERLASLERARESFFARLIAWQRLSRSDDVDLAEFIAELRAEIGRLAAENEAAYAREETLLDALARTEPETPNVEESIPRFLAVSALPSEVPMAAISFDDARSALESIESEAKRIRAQRLAGELSSGREDVRLSAARHLVETAGALAAPALMAAVRAAPGDDERIGMLELLARTGAPLARVSIEGCLEDENPLVRAAALEAKLVLAAPDELPAIAQVGLADSDSRVRRRMILAVKASSKQDVSMLLVPVTRDPDPQARRAACAALAGERAPEVIKALVEALDDEVEGVRAAAAQSLAKVLGDDAARVAKLPPPLRRRAIADLREREMRHGAG